MGFTKMKFGSALPKTAGKNLFFSLIAFTPFSFKTFSLFQSFEQMRHENESRPRQNPLHSTIKDPLFRLLNHALACHFQ